MNKKYTIGIITLIVAFLSWYLFIKKNDYTINLKIKTSTGTLFQGVKEWANNRKKLYNENYQVLSKNNFEQLTQKLQTGDKTTIYDWTFLPVNDSVTQVSVAINQKGSSIYNRLTVPFFPTEFKQNQIEKIKDFKEGLEQHLKNFKIKIDGIQASEETTIAFIKLKSSLQEKAQTMIMNDSKLTGFLKNNNIKITGKPYVEIEKWDLEKEQLQFNYCFPVDKKTTFINDSIVHFKTLKSVKGIQATYFGNYRTSDKAWFQILDYAKKRNIKLQLNPIEHYFANPYNGGNELDWETKIIIPIQ